MFLGKFSLKIQDLGLKSPIWGKFRGKIKILSTRDLLCRKFAAVKKLQLSALHPLDTTDSVSHIVNDDCPLTRFNSYRACNSADCTSLRNCWR